MATGFPRRWLLIVSPFIAIFFVYHFYLTPTSQPATQPITQPPVAQNPPAPDHAPGQPKPNPVVGQEKPKVEPPPVEFASKEELCGNLPHDMDDVLVVLKTGATEALEKVPVHLRTTLQCVPHFAIFSDYEETINGVRTQNVIRNVKPNTLQNEPEFGFYHRLQKVGREGLTEAEWGDHTNGPLGKVNNPGWKLDKWKFLPMVDKAFETMPKAKWFIFLEADTYIVWQNVITWLAHLDWNRPYYLGSPMQIGDMLFAYGGAGIILSQNAVQQLHGYTASKQEDLERMTAGEWAGDCALARALGDLQIPLTWAWPMMLTSRPWELDHFSEGYGRQPWCYPVVSYHHMTEEDIDLMWHFDRGFFKSGKNALLLHGDVFRKLIHDQSLRQLDEWDNLAGTVIDFAAPTEPSLQACAEVCARNSECLQYTFNKNDRVCKHSATAMRGIPSPGTQSGWMQFRIKKLLKSFQSSCGQVEYIFE
ncbi:hypothetical protein NUU61_007578 [Penicillium alfredii]|uniref:N-acetylgalactosaminide beta-1,3-galactosyltransferase n=1 Tax=Penicillium alfredii TaxID=1506179 RepID=A0A9W9EQV7_9EURO|nr:uncharacterized protein NUU61_007578 [Penicillium alfredii]KAJ5086271.1 hypothetical protein NUU61_007578 [Penicillium alfredii]